jgi:hypothetical protein
MTWCGYAPRYPEALNMGSDWIKKALDAVDLKKHRIALSYLRGARTMTERADMLLDGKLSPDLQVAKKIPKYVRKADSAMAKLEK